MLSSCVMYCSHKSHSRMVGLCKCRLVFWSAVAAGGLGLTKRSSKLSFRAEVVAQHVNSFVERRIVRPLTK
jgi:hypothetical protein